MPAAIFSSRQELSVRVASLVSPRTSRLLLLLLCAGALSFRSAPSNAATLPPLPLQDVRAGLIAQQAGAAYDAAPAALRTAAVSSRDLEPGVATVTFSSATSPA